MGNRRGRMELRHSVIGRLWAAVWVRRIGVSVAIIVLATAAFFGWRSLQDPIQRDTYQLINLTTGESYIGKLESTSGRYLTLRDVYFQRKNAEDAPDTEVTVVKLSSTVAKPQDVMYIASDKIVHWENLARDSKIVQVIEQDGDK